MMIHTAQSMIQITVCWLLGTTQLAVVWNTGLSRTGTVTVAFGMARTYTTLTVIFPYTTQTFLNPVCPPHAAGELTGVWKDTSG